VTSFSAQVFQNEYLAEGARTVDAVVTVTAQGEGPAGPIGSTQGDTVEVIIIDTSGSMNEEGGAKIRAARQATIAAVDVIRDGVWFAVIGGANNAHMVFPGQIGLVQADRATREMAKSAVAQLNAAGGTAIGTWLRAANELFAQRQGALAHAILLTDGKNQHEEDWQLDAAIAECVGRFQCDARGLGSDWNVAELRKVSSALLGTVDIIPRPEDMVAAFTGLTQQAMGRQVAATALRLWTPQGSQLEFVRQVAPDLEDLSAKAVPVNALTRDFPLGAWSGDESRDYHIRVQVPAGNVGDERLAARIMLMVDTEQVSNALVRALWTDDEALSTRINREVAHYTGQAELADAIHEGLAARAAGDQETATMRLGRAVALAHASGNDDTVRLLGKVVDVDDAASGTVRLKREVEAVDAMALDVRSTRTVRVNKG